MADLKSGLVSIQFQDIDVSSKEAVAAALNCFAPAIIENIMVCTSGDRSRGCGFSGSVSAGSGGVSGSATVTCSF